MIKFRCKVEYRELTTVVDQYSIKVTIHQDFNNQTVILYNNKLLNFVLKDLGLLVNNINYKAKIIAQNIIIKKTNKCLKLTWKIQTIEMTMSQM